MGKIPPSSVDLAIVVPPAYDQDTSSTKHSRKSLERVMTNVHKAVKPGGVCCLILSGSLSHQRDVVHTADMRILKSLEKKWNYREEIIWVKADRDASRSVSGMEQIESISLDTIPFSHICVLEKRSSRFEYLDRTERLSSLKISASKKMEMEDSIWYAVPKSGEKYKDRLAKEVAVRLIMLYSKKGEIVLDPFADCGLIEVTAKVLGRRYIAFASDLKSYSNIKRRLE